MIGVVYMTLIQDSRFEFIRRQKLYKLLSTPPPQYPMQQYCCTCRSRQNEMYHLSTGRDSTAILHAKNMHRLISCKRHSSSVSDIYTGIYAGKLREHWVLWWLCQRHRPIDDSLRAPLVSVQVDNQAHRSIASGILMKS